MVVSRSDTGVARRYDLVVQSRRCIRELESLEELVFGSLRTGGEVEKRNREDGGQRYAGLWIRFAALVIDGTLFCAVFFPMTRIVKGVWLMTPGDHQWVAGWFVTDPLCVAFLAVMFIYFCALEGLVGTTLGKWILGLQVIGASGGRPGLAAGAIRNLLRVADGLPVLCLLGAVLIIVLPERTRVGDLVARTRVIKVSR